VTIVSLVSATFSALTQSDSPIQYISETQHFAVFLH